MAAFLPPLWSSCLRSKNPDISIKGLSSVFSGFPFRKLPARLRVVKLGLRFRRDESPRSDEGPDGEPRRKLSVLLTPEEIPARVLSGVMVGSLLLESAVVGILVPMLL